MLSNQPIPALFPSPSGAGVITKTEMEVLKRIYLPDKNIAADMYISSHTVSSHRQNLSEKTGYKTKIELAVYATKKGYIEWVN
ncbi:MAG TPA: helix-turn-helix transcriptional regulator [Pedobacter sp.]|uniref:response regulator transcription factor n=1 Tax=Pedobacter sp. TaxID=1411316 RepID=UPI002B6211C2|nr:helix-turn-helix transcriptional regulator [Pedobacter sp.]HMI01816.1 helix-turn-helix transcriptional regulator [Pedobacter sp.]